MSTEISDIEIHYRFDELDKTHEYSIVTPFRSDAECVSYFSYWLWYYLGYLTKGKHHSPTMIPFANSWDKKSKIIKVYTDTRDAEICANRIYNFIKKHYSKKTIKQKV